MFMELWQRGMLVANRHNESDLVRIDRNDIIMFAHSAFDQGVVRTAMNDVAAIDDADIAILRMMEKHSSFE
jgi:hypothetical protein